MGLLPWIPKSRSRLQARVERLHMKRVQPMSLIRRKLARPAARAARAAVAAVHPDLKIIKG